MASTLTVTVLDRRSDTDERDDGRPFDNVDYNDLNGLIIELDWTMSAGRTGSVCALQPRRIKSSLVQFPSRPWCPSERHGFALAPCSRPRRRHHSSSPSITTIQQHALFCGCKMYFPLTSDPCWNNNNIGSSANRCGECQEPLSTSATLQPPSASVALPAPSATVSSTARLPVAAHRSTAPVLPCLRNTH